MYPKSYPPELSTDEEEHLIAELEDWSIAHGLTVRAAVPTRLSRSSSLATTAPVTLYPSLFPRVCFEQAQSVMSAYNELYAAIACSHMWLGETLGKYVGTAAPLLSSLMLGGTGLHATSKRTPGDILYHKRRTKGFG